MQHVWLQHISVDYYLDVAEHLVLLKKLEPVAQFVELYCIAKIAGRLELKAHGKCSSLSVKTHLSLCLRYLSTVKRSVRYVRSPVTCLPGQAWCL